MSRNRRRHRTARVLSCSVIATLAGMSASAAASAAVSKASGNLSKFTVAWVSPDSQIPALISIGNGIQREANQLGMKYVTESANYDPTVQSQAISTLIARHVSVIMTTPIVAAALAPDFAKAQKMGIKVIEYDSTPAANVEVDVTNPDQQAASNAVGTLKQALAKKGEKCALGLDEGTKTVHPLAARDAGFVAGAKKYGCTIVNAQVDIKDTIDSAQAIAEAWKSQYGTKITAMLAQNDTAAEGLVAAETSSWDPLIVGMNGESEAVSDVKSGKFLAEYGLENIEIGEGMGYAAGLLLQGKHVPAQVSLPYTLITKQNAGSFLSDAGVLAKPIGTIKITGSGSSALLKVTPGH
jgi:ABC-type sugar transport system substrate-binding protein